MAPLALSTHTGRTVTVDHCRPCRLVWFDTLESVQLDGLGWVRLLREMQAAGAPSEPSSPSEPPEAGRPMRPQCPSCHLTLAEVSNQTRFGRFVMLECPRRHGHLHSHAGVLAERGLVRPLLGPERKALREERHRIACFNCGAPADGASDRCSYCDTPLVVIDLPRLALSLKPRVADEATAPVQPGRAVNWSCRGCGAALDPSRDAACAGCGHVVVVLDLPDIGPLLDAAEDELIVAAARRAGRRRPPEPAEQPAAEPEPDPAAITITTSSTQGPVSLAEWLYGPMLGGWTPLWLALGLSLVAAWLS
jgi:hypothetical protein